MSKIRTSSTAEYFAKNLQQVGFSSPTKAVLTTLKEAVDNSLDACEEVGILPHIKIKIKKEGVGSSKNADLISVTVEDNGPGLDEKDIPKVFGEYLASSKFGQGRCSRGQQGIGISAATTWAQLTNAKGVRVISKTKRMNKAISVLVDMDIKNNKGRIKNRQTISWDKKHGLKVEFFIDGRAQLNGDGGLITYLEGTALVNPHLELEYDLIGQKKRKISRVSQEVPRIPPATLPHPHTMKLGEFLHHAGLYGKVPLKKFLQTGFSKMSPTLFDDMKKAGLKTSLINKPLASIDQAGYKEIFQTLHKVELPNPSTRSVLIVGEEGLTESIHRLGDIDFFSVITRKPKICDHKSVVVEVAIARLKGKTAAEDSSIQLLRFANRVPLQFDKASCAITKSVESVNWKTYGLNQSKKSLPTGPYVFAIAVTSPFIKFKNASKETIDASEELVEEIRLALMKAGQKLQRHIRKEQHTEDLIRKKEYIEKFAPILIRKLKDVTSAPQKDVKQAEEGLYKILSKGAKAAEKALSEAESRLEMMKEQRLRRKGFVSMDETLKSSKKQKAAKKGAAEKKATEKKEQSKKAASKSKKKQLAKKKKQAKPKKAAQKKKVSKKKKGAKKKQVAKPKKQTKKKQATKSKKTTKKKQASKKKSKKRSRR